MRDVQQLLAEKENEMVRLQKEIQSLQLILPLLADEAHVAASDSTPESSHEVEKKPPENAPLSGSASQATGTEGASRTQSQSRLWGFTKRWRSK